MLGYEQVSLKRASEHGHALKRKYRDLRLWEQERKVQRSEVGEDWVKEELLGCLAGLEDDVLGHNVDLKVKADLSSDRSVQLAEMLELAEEEVKNLELNLDMENFDMQGLFCTKFKSEKLEGRRNDESEEEQRSSGGAAGSAEGLREPRGTEGYQNGHLMEGSARLKKVSNHVNVQRARIGSPVIGDERDFEVAENLFGVSYNELCQKEARVVENWVRE
jgi:hypothetical protein